MGEEKGAEEDYFNTNAQRGGRGARRGDAPGRTAQETPRQRRRAPARKQGGTGEEEEQEEEELEEDDMEEDYYNTRTSFRDRGARDAPVVEVPESYAFLLRDLAGRSLRAIARSLGEGNSEAAHTAVTALFDLPAVVTDHSGRPLQALDGGHTLTKLSRSVLVPDAIKAEAHASRNRRRDQQSTEGRGPSLGNAALGGEDQTRRLRLAEERMPSGSMVGSRMR